MTPAAEFATRFHDAMTGPGHAPMEKAEADALRAGLDLLVHTVNTLDSIADSLRRLADMHAPHPSQDGVSDIGFSQQSEAYQASGKL